MGTKVTTLEVMIATLGLEGIGKVAAGKHPRMEGVGYVVAWQQPDGEIPVPESLARRPDFKIIVHNSRGVAKNRNVALEAATADVVLVSDDDVDYTEEGLLRVRQAFDGHPEWDFISFRYDSDNPKRYPAESFELPHIPRGHFFSNIEMAMRRRTILEKGIRFNENYGIGAPVFNMGEEDVLIHDLLRGKVSGGYLPVSICRHQGSTTCERQMSSPASAMTKGAVVSLYHPLSWPLRFLLEAWRARCGGSTLPYWDYVRFCYKGRRVRRSSEKGL